MPENRKVVFLGIDAGSRDLVLQWAKNRILPTFHSLLSKGLTGFTTSLPGFFVGSTWASFYTGVNPAKHGVHSLRQLKLGTYDLYNCFAGKDIKREPFWNHLSRAGCKVAILDVPLTSLSKDLHGIQLVEYGAHDAHNGFMTWPLPLADEVEKRFGPPALHLINGNCNANRGSDEFAASRDTLIQGVKRKAELTKHFLRSNRWDFFAQVFTESHCIGHQCWHLHDSTHQWHDREVAKIIGDPIRDVYVAIDKAIGNILEEIDDKTTVFIIFSHGMGPTNVPWGFLQKLLLHLKVLAPPKMTIKNLIKVLVRQKIIPVCSKVWQQTPTTIQNSLEPMESTLSKWLYSLPGLPRIDVAAGKCFSIHDNPSHAGIRVNLIGREPKGTVRPGKEYQNFCKELEKDLLAIINVGTGKPIINQIIRTAEYYEGDYLEHLPDLLVEWNQEDPIPAVFSDKIGKIPVNFRHPRTGHHRPGGMFIVLGPSIKPGFLNRTVSIMDFAPTFASLLNVSLPDVDGQPIYELNRSSLAKVQVSPPGFNYVIEQ